MTKSLRTFSRLTALCLFCVTSAQTTACSSDGVDGEGESPVLGKTSEALDWEAVLCAIVDKIPDQQTDDVSLTNVFCNHDANDNLYYFGSAPPGNFSKTLATANYCTLATANTVPADATFNTRFGRFGTKSRLRTFARNNQTRHIETEHFGDVVVFGVGAPLQYNTTSWDFLSEHQPAKNAAARRDDGTRYTQSLPDQQGEYARWRNHSLTKYGFDASGTIKIPKPFPDIKISVSLKSNEQRTNYNNGKFAQGVAPWSSYSDFVAPYEACINAPCTGWLCVCPEGPTAAQVRGHELLCASGACDSDYFRNLTDGVLPYSGAGFGARGNIVYNVHPALNYWQTGQPGGPAVEPAHETVYGLLTSNPGPSTDLSLSVEAGYFFSLAKFTVTTKLDFMTRAGTALRNTAPDDPDANSSDPVRTQLTIDAETAVNLDATAHLHVDLGPFLSPYDGYFSYDMLDRKGDGHRSSPTLAARTYSWSGKLTGQNELDTAACTAQAPPDTSVAQPPSTNALTFLKEVALAEVDNFHPCNVKICIPTSGRTGKLTNYNWDATTHSLVAQPTNQVCDICDSSGAMCDGTGTVVAPLASAKSTSCGGTGPICAGGRACDSEDDCSGTYSRCSQGCCGAVK